MRPLPLKKRRLAELRREVALAKRRDAWARNPVPEPNPAELAEEEDLRERAVNLEAALRVSSQHFAKACENLAYCSVCELEFDSQDARVQSLTSIAKRVDDIKRRRRAHSPIPVNVSQREHNLRLRQGVSVYMRQLKAAVLTRKRCPACRRDFTGDELATVLKMMDRKSNPLYLSLTSSLMQ